LPWEDYGCQVAGVAYNGKDGITLIRQVLPDILFTDIRMPGMDGLTMIAALKSEFPRLQITVLTGFRDFEYAQTAIRLGVCRFLLKPSKMEELHEALTAMTHALKSIPVQEELSPQEDETPELSDTAVVEEDKKADATHSFVVKKALKFIDEQYATKLTLADVAEHTYISQWHLSKLLKRHTNSSFYDLLNGARIRAAKELLKDPSLKIGDVARMVGFADTAHFAKTFKKMEGCSANEYRNTLPG
jgi:two-component system response regulator YesN